MAKIDLIAGCKNIRPKRRPKWYQKLRDPDAEQAVRKFMQAWHAGELVDYFGENKSAAARYLKEKTGTKASVLEIRETIKDWGTPDGPG